MNRLCWLQAARDRRLVRAIDETIANTQTWKDLCSAGRPNSPESRRAWKRLESSLVKFLMENSA